MSIDLLGYGLGPIRIKKFFKERLVTLVPECRYIAK